jgi:tRNA A37 threonylcarbamoyltransferase TsaD
MKRPPRSIVQSSQMVIVQAPPAGALQHRAVPEPKPISAFGGVVPEIAARAHVDALDDVIAAALKDARVDLAGIDAVAATAGPGLMGGLIVGLTTAKAVALAAGQTVYCGQPS